MSQDNNHLIKISADGRKFKALYDDKIRDALEKLGSINIRRASHVEINENLEWVADLSPINEGTLGPFRYREDAIKAEIEFINQKLRKGEL